MEPFQKFSDGVLIECTEEEILEILARQEVALAEEQGRIALELVEYMQEFRDMRRELLNVLAGIALAEDMLDEFKVAREALLDIPQVLSVANATTAAEAKAACKVEYMKVVAVSPPQFILAFKELNG